MTAWRVALITGMLVAISLFYLAFGGQAATIAAAFAAAIAAINLVFGREGDRQNPIEKYVRAAVTNPRNVRTAVICIWLINAGMGTFYSMELYYEPIILKGQVYDANKRPVSTFALEVTGGERAIRATTDATGGFRFEIPKSWKKKDLKVEWNKDGRPGAKNVQALDDELIVIVLPPGKPPFRLTYLTLSDVSSSLLADGMIASTLHHLISPSARIVKNSIFENNSRLHNNYGDLLEECGDWYIRAYRNGEEVNDEIADIQQLTVYPSSCDRQSGLTYHRNDLLNSLVTSKEWPEEFQVSRPCLDEYQTSEGMDRLDSKNYAIPMPILIKPLSTDDLKYFLDVEKERLLDLRSSNDIAGIATFISEKLFNSKKVKEVSDSNTLDDLANELTTLNQLLLDDEMGGYYIDENGNKIPYSKEKQKVVEKRIMDIARPYLDRPIKAVEALEFLAGTDGIPEGFGYVEARPEDHGGVEVKLFPRVVEVRVAIIESAIDGPINIDDIVIETVTSPRLRAEPEHPELYSFSNEESSGYYPLKVLHKGEQLVIPVQLSLHNYEGSTYSSLPMEKECYDTYWERWEEETAKLDDKSRIGILTHYLGNELMTKMLSSLRKLPQSPPFDKKFNFGAEIRVRKVVVDGIDYPAREDSHDDITIVAGNEAGSCPYLFVRFDEANGWERHGVILERADSQDKEAFEIVQLRDLPARIRISEREPERTYLNYATMKVEHSSGEVSVFSPSDARLHQNDGEYVVLEQGQGFDLIFPGLEKFVEHTSVALEIGGYYDSYSAIRTRQLTRGLSEDVGLPPNPSTSSLSGMPDESGLR
jgi:hypothetical protein